jgi:hypothetical protein
MGPMVVKRKATDEPSTPLEAKRIKTSNSPEVEEKKLVNQANVIPFPEKVCCAQRSSTPP